MRILLGLLIACLALADAARAAESSSAKTVVVLTTSLGDIKIALETERAPLTSQNFLKYVDAGRFDGASFYRAIKSADGSEGLVQGGLQNRNNSAPVAHESTVETGLSHVDGAVSMARSKPGSATAEFFIIIGQQLNYDGVPNGGDPGFAVFGRVISGMPIARKIMRLPRSKEKARTASMQGQMLAQPVTIVTARRLGSSP